MVVMVTQLSFFCVCTVNVNKLLFGEMKLAEREREKQAFKNKHLGEFPYLTARWNLCHYFL